MATTYTQSAIANLSTLIDGVATAGLRNLANNTCRLGPEIIPTAAGPELLSLPQLTAKFTGNPTANIVVAQCWLIEAKYNGSSWVYPTIGASSDGSTTVYPAWAPAFIMQAIPREVARPAGRFKVLLRNVSGQATANTNDTDTILKEATVNALGT